MMNLMAKRSPAELIWVSAAVSIALSVTLAASQLTLPYVPVNQLLGDLWVETDAIWRASLGQDSSRDFITPLGPLFYGVYSLLTLVEPPSLAVMVHGNLLMGVASALLAFGISRRLASPEVVILLMLLVFLTAASGRAIGTPLAGQAVPYIVPYNRWSWAIAIPCAFGLLTGHRGSGRLASILIGLGLAALFFIKLSYFVGLCVLAGASLFIDAYPPAERRAVLRRAFVLAAALALFLALGALLWAPSSYLADVRMIAAANYVTFRLLKFAIQLVEAGLTLGLAVLIYQLASNFRPPAWQDIARIFLMIGAGAAIMSQNHENNEAPLYFGALLLAYALGNGRAERSRDSVVGPPSQRAAFYLTLLILLVPMTADAGTAAIARLRVAANPQPAIGEFRNTPLADLRSGNRQEIAVITDGLALLDRIGQSGRTVLPFTMGNPLSALTGTRSPRGSMAIWYYGRTFSEDHLPPADRALGDAEILMIRKQDPTSEWLWRLYAPAIRSSYRLAGESPYWIAWQRTPAPLG
ncbi:MAG TPA: hypothetical protein VF688_02805 [Allosphingosinicella sp.]|jgi:hypothetical protein